MGKKTLEKPFIFNGHLTELVLFILAIFIITSWINHHIDALPWVTSFVNLFAVLYGIIGLVKNVANEADGKKSKVRLQNALLAVLNPVVIFILYAMIIVVGNSVTTITLYSEDIKDATSVSVAPTGDPDHAKSDSFEKKIPKIWFFLICTPFGTSYDVNATGYLRKSFEIYPWVGKKIHVADDLQPVPSFIVRYIGKPEELVNGFAVVRSNGALIDSAQLETGHSAVLFGKRKTIPSDWKEMWELKLDQVAPGSDPQAGEFRASVFSAWLNYLHRPVGIPEPGSIVDVVFYDGSKAPIATTNFILTKDTFQDYLIN
jgi:hypothetical protein